jgi:hypothetical protein
MLAALRGRAYDSHLRLYAAVSLRRYWGAVSVDCSGGVVQAALRLARAETALAPERLTAPPEWSSDRSDIAYQDEQVTVWVYTGEWQAAQQAEALRRVFGKPFRVPV